MTTTLDEITRWANTVAAEQSTDVEVPPDSRFPVDETLNNKIAMWRGNHWEIEADVIVNEGDEEMTAKKSPQLFAAAGPALALEIQNAEVCKTGECVVTSAYNLPAKKIVHTVGPRFTAKYHIAAENMLNSCYWGALQKLVEYKLQTIAFCCIHNEEYRNYNPWDASHIAIRTVRRFLEKYGNKIELVVLCMPDDVTMSVYNAVLPLYFPRTKAEEFLAITELPRDTGNSKGETVTEERSIRISAFPVASLSTKRDTEPQQSSTSSSVAVQKNSTSSTNSAASVLEEEDFTSMKPDIDEERRSAIIAQLASEEEEAVYNRYLKYALSEDFSDIRALQVIHQCGVDLQRRSVFAIQPSNLSDAVDMNRVMFHTIKIMDSVVGNDYVIVYFNSDAGTKKANLAWFKNVYNILPRKYKKNLKAVYVVHPGLLMRAMLWFAKPFISDKFWGKVVNVHSITELYTYISRDQIRIPQAVVQFDSRQRTRTSSANTNPHDNL